MFAGTIEISENVAKFSGKCDYKLMLRSTNLVYREWWGDDGGCGDRGRTGRLGAGVERACLRRARRSSCRRRRPASALAAGLLRCRDQLLFRADRRAAAVAGYRGGERRRGCELCIAAAS